MEASRKLTAAKNQIEIFTKDSASFKYSSFSELRNESLHLLRVKRDGDVIELPDILLVRGDSVYVDSEKEFQRISKLTEPDGENLGLFPRFVTLHTSKFVPFLRECVSRRELKTNWIDSKVNIMRRCLIYVMLLALIVAAIRRRCAEFFASCWYFFVFYPVPWVFWLRCYANSRIIVLWELLKHSQNPYDDIDEFDENEPPPTIDLYVPLRRILYTMYLFVREQIVGFDLCDNLSLSSFVAYTDRCGTLCDKYPTITKVLVFCESSLLEPDVILDTVPFEGGNAGFQFEDRGWIQFQASLRPLGLCASLMGSCRLERKGFYHKLDSNKYEWVKDSPADQICFCSLGKVLGFQPHDIADYKLLKYFLLDCSKQSCREATGRNTIDEQLTESSSCSKNNSTPISNGNIISIKIFKSSSQTFVVCEGNPEILLPFVTNYWTGTNILAVDGKINKKIGNFTNTCSNTDTYNSVFGFKLLLDPLPSNICYVLNKDNSGNSSVKFVDCDDSEFVSLAKLIQGLTLVGILGLSFEPKEDISAFIDDLEQAGIRFVYFSPLDQKSTKAFGDRLGLETDWNSCILLNEPKYLGNGTAFPVRGYSDRSDINARLPQGPHQIRYHLENVDDIPLHVSLFANSYDNMGAEIRELFEIFHEQGETVCLVGNCLNPSNFFLFRSADIAIGMEPSYAQNSEKTSSGLFNPCTSMHLANTLVSTFCSLDGLPFKSSPYILTEIIREGRSLLDVCFQIISYILVEGTSFCIFSSLFRFPLFNLWGIIPVAIVSVMLLGNTHDECIMRLLPAKKNEDETKIYLFNPRRLIAYFLIKCAASVMCYAMLSDYLQIVLFQMLSSAFYLHRNISLKSSFLSQLNYIWLTFIVVFACCTSKLWLSWRIFIAFPISLCINELCKKHDRVNWLKTQKRLKLEFNTRLGMHSPV